MQPVSMKKIAPIIVVPLLLLCSCSLNKAVTSAYKRAMKHSPYDVVIVPGFPYHYPSKDSILLNLRLYWAKELYDKGITRNIIFSGAAVHTPYGEGAIMKTMADALGIPKEHTFVEDKAQHTTSNAKLGKKMARSLGFKKIAAATDPFQFSYMRVLMWFSAPGVPILTFPPDTPSIQKYLKPLPVVNEESGFVRNFVPLEGR